MTKNMKEELESLSYQDIADLILKEKKKGQTTLELFTNVCKKLKLSEQEIVDKIGDFYTALTFDKRFIILKNGKWDLRTNHLINIEIEDNEDEEEIDEENNSEENETDDEVNDNIDENKDDDIEDDELEDLVIIDTEDLNEN